MKCVFLTCQKHAFHRLSQNVDFHLPGHVKNTHFIDFRKMSIFTYPDMSKTRISSTFAKSRFSPTRTCQKHAFHRLSQKVDFHLPGPVKNTHFIDFRKKSIFTYPDLSKTCISSTSTKCRFSPTRTCQ